MSRKVFLKVGGGALAGATMVPWLGCGDDSSTSDGAPVSGKPVDVELTMWSHEGDVAKFLDKQAAMLSKQSGAKYNYKPIKITVLPLQEVATKTLAALSARRALPDILGVEVNYFSRYMRNDLASKVFVDLTDKVSKERSQVFDPAWANYTLKDRIYAIESGYTLVGYYYREDLAKEVGITFPIDTWDEFLEVGIKQAKPKGKYLSTIAVGKGGVGTPGVSAQFIMWLLQRGGSIFSPDGQSVTLDSSESVDALSFMVKGLKEGVFLDVDALYGPADTAALKSGKVIGHEGADWWRFVITRNLPEQEGKWHLTEMPKFSGGGTQTATMGGTGYAVSKESKNQDAAWQLVKAGLLTPEGQQRKFTELSFNPTLKSAFEDKFFLDYEDEVLGGQKKFADVYSKLAPVAPVQHQSPFWSFALEALDGEVGQALSGRKSPQQAIKDATKKLEQDVAKSS